MRKRFGLRWNVLITGICLLLFAGCAAKNGPATTPEPAAAPAPPPAARDFAPVYERLSSDAQSYRDGLERIASGDEIGGEQRIAEAANSIRALAEACLNQAGCEVVRFIETLNDLLTEHGIALKQQAFRIETLEASAAAVEVEREPGTSPFVAAMPELSGTVSLLRGTELRDMIQLNGPVQAALDDWLTWMRPMLLTAYENYQFLRDDIAPVYEEAGLPEALLFAMMATESGGKVHSYSRAGAAGPLQFMRYTGRKYGLQVVDGFDMRLDPVSATRANVAYLDDQFEVLNDDLEKALAAYNGGESRMARLNRKYSGVPLWDHRFYYALPAETREYVPRVLAAAWLFLHPDEYNLEFPVSDNAKTTLVVGEPISIGELAICLGQAGSRDGWFRVLRNLNPRLSPGDRLDPGSELVVPQSVVPIYEEHCASGSELMVRARGLHDANYPDGPQIVRYTVRRGDTLGKIASRHRCSSVQQIAELNNIRAPRFVIQVGQQIKIPTCG